MEQLEIDFEPGLTEHFPSFHDCVKAAVYDCGRAFKVIAADLDMSSSRLSRMLNEGDEGIHFPIHRLPELIAATGDLRPVYWLVETFCRDAAAKREQAMRALTEILPALTKALHNAGLGE